METRPSAVQPDREFLPISMLNQLEYCERRFYLMHVLGEMEINAHVLEGTFRHEQAHMAQAEKQGIRMVHRRVYVWSDRLEVAGYTDILDETAVTPSGKTGASGPLELTPIEYKKGKMGRWLNDHIQLCAQALCLEERTGTQIQRGYIFYFGSRRRQEILFDEGLRRRTEQAVARAQALVREQRLPPPLAQRAKCRDCSLEPVCLPEEVQILSGENS